MNAIQAYVARWFKGIDQMHSRSTFRTRERFYSIKIMGCAVSRTTDRSSECNTDVRGEMVERFRSNVFALDVSHQRAILLDKNSGMRCFQDHRQEQ